MGAAVEEKDVLKLVHAGRFAEIHTKPITAAEAMRRNPGHFITRPDVFKFPYIVVRPESVLMPGNVFFIVPKRTIYRLLKEREHDEQPTSARQNQSPKYHDDNKFLKQASPSKSWADNKFLKQASPSTSSAGMTPKHHDHSQFHEQKYWITPSDEQSNDEQDCDPSDVESWPDEIVKHKITHQEYGQDSIIYSALEIRPSHSRRNHCGDNNIRAAWPKQEGGDQEVKGHTRVAVLKSCLRKQDTVRKSLGLRVSFLLPKEDSEKPEKPRRVTRSPGEYAGLLSR